ncbi:hypothetical protein KR093_004832 [Drosophila rubida]|uniref:Peptidase S1 domain-containing protein n=1 Tax=Drosophila rubida TaxID=30044 RepID=A0AAD4JWV8_9MUSC|nr:hypothetical protein KR093_004832 [Drosophila rubida]
MWQLILLTFLVHQRSLQAQHLPEKRIINGFNAVPKQFPYQVYLEVRENCKFQPYCGGVIISNRTILTAAHCVPKSLILFGALDRSNELEKGQQRLIATSKFVVVHPEYDTEQLLNDIALIRLPTEIRFDEYIQPAKLPDLDQLYDNENAVTSGWGLTNREQPPPTQLLYLNVTVFAYDDCRPIVHKHYPGRFVPASWICLKPSQSTPCYGDSGGPLAIRNDDGTNTLIGLTSFGMNCSLNTPVMYTRVSSFLQWIKQNA